MLVQATVAETGLDFAEIDRFAATVGPGSFTGLRVGLAFAKGLALAVGRPCIGIGTLEALAASAPGAGLTVAVIDAKRGQVYLQAFADGRPIMAPDSLALDVAAARLVELGAGRAIDIVGPGATLLDGVLSGARILAIAAPDPVAIARLAESRPVTPARPLYLRAPDAKLPGGLDLPA